MHYSICDFTGLQIIGGSTIDIIVYNFETFSNLKPLLYCILEMRKKPMRIIMTQRICIGNFKTS
jgi:hypothetical protein